MENFKLTQTATQVQKDLNVIESIEANFSAEKLYYAGDLAIYEGKLYQCTSGTTFGPAAFDTDYWQEAKLSDLFLTRLGGTITDHTYNVNWHYNKGDTVYFRGYLYTAIKNSANPAGPFKFSDWEKTSVESLIGAKQDIISVDNKLDYSLLSNTPTIPTVNNATLTIQKNSTTVDTFTANASVDKIINITVPTKTSDIENDSGYVTSTELADATGVKTGLYLHKINVTSSNKVYIDHYDTGTTTESTDYYTTLLIYVVSTRKDKYTKFSQMVTDGNNSAIVSGKFYTWAAGSGFGSALASITMSGGAIYFRTVPGVRSYSMTNRDVSEIEGRFTVGYGTEPEIPSTYTYTVSRL